MGTVQISFIRPTPVDDTSDAGAMVIAAHEGRSLMSEAVRTGVPGIAADCGGVLTCSTCHVFVRAPSFDALPPLQADEEDMLAFTATPRRWNSRLSCQVTVTQALDGMVVDLPASQY